jgi:ergothioneine biosynthesis protein EgtB
MMTEMPETNPIRRVRTATIALTDGLTAEDMGAQAMADASPIKWHLAHTTWFFETFVLAAHCHDWRPFNAQFRRLFNSYYHSIGDLPCRPRRGQLTRPSLDEILAWREVVDDALPQITGAESLITLGLAHEEQHQELMITDQLALFARRPLEPSWQNPPPARPPVEGGWVECRGGTVEIGWDGSGFAFDNEGPRHPVILAPYRIARRPVTNDEVFSFIADGGYRRPLLWQDDGWEAVSRNGWQAPEYWRRQDGAWTMLTPWGRDGLCPDAPARHLSWWEADAIARWAGARLPTEEEWEAACGHFPYGRVWEWTASPHRPYAGWKAPVGALGEYNGKFMSSRFVLRGGSDITPMGHMRTTYRNFFPPSARWQFSGVRLAEDA